MVLLGFNSWGGCRRLNLWGCSTDNEDEPVGYFIAWTVSGTFLQGDLRWWRKRNAGQLPPQPLLEQWHRDRLEQDVILLSNEHRAVVNGEIENHCNRRGWKLWLANATTNHVHVVVSTLGYVGDTVRDQRKANCTRAMREADDRFVDRPVWIEKGDARNLKTEDDLKLAILYAGETHRRGARLQAGLLAGGR